MQKERKQERPRILRSYSFATIFRFLFHFLKHFTNRQRYYVSETELKKKKQTKLKARNYSYCFCFVQERAHRTIIGRLLVQ